jgi:predicted PurR-regulated permease PerM
MSNGLHQDLTRTVLAVLFLAGLVGTSIWLLAPFLPATIWAMTLVIATWPLMRRVQAAFWNSRSVAVVVMTAAFLLIFVAPFWFAVGTIVKNVEPITQAAHYVAVFKVPPTPGWIAGLPVIGSSAAQAWDSVAASGIDDLAPLAAPYAGKATEYFVGAAGGLGSLFLQFLLTVVIAAILYARGEQAAASALRFGHRLAGERGAQAVRLVGMAIRGVALGVVVTALAQTAVGGIGLLLVGVPFAAVLTALMLLLCIAQIGPAPVLIPAVIWMYYSGQTFWASVLVAFSLFAILLDNVLRPILIRRGADLPLLLILVGVIGGLMSFGLVGIFLGPAVLAVTYTLLQAWIAEDSDPVLPSVPVAEKAPAELTAP